MPANTFDYYLEQAKKSLTNVDEVTFLKSMGVVFHLVSALPEKKADVLFLYAEGLYKLNHFKEAFEAIEEALTYFEDEDKYTLLIAKGVTLGKLGGLPEAQKIFEDLLSLREYPDIQNKALNNLAWLYIYRYKKEGRSDYLDLVVQKCIDFRKRFDGVESVALIKQALVNLGTAYWYQCKYHLALETFFEALQYVPGDAKVLNNLASTYAKLNEREKAEQCLNQAEWQAEQRKDIFEKAQSYRIRAEIAENDEEYVKAIDYYIVAQNEYNAAQTFIETQECAERIDHIMGIIRREAGDLLKSRLKSSSGVVFGREHHFTYQK